MIRHLSGNARIWALSASLAAVAVAIGLMVARGATVFDPDVTLPAWVFGVMFYVAEAYVVHIHFRRDAESFSLSELPLVVGLFFASPAGLLLARATGTAAALAFRRRQHPQKLVFNIALVSMETALAIAIFRAVASPAGILGMREGSAALGSVLAASAAGIVLVMVAISLAGGEGQRRVLPRVLTLGLIAAFTNATLGLVAVATVRIEEAVALLLAVPAAVLFFAYRAYTAERGQHEKLERLHEATRAMQRSIELEPTIRALLEQGRTMFRAEIAEITLLPSDGEEQATCTRLGPDDLIRTVGAVTLDPTEGVWARAVSEGQAVLVARPIRSPRLRAHFEAAGIRDAIVAPLFGKDGIVGILTIANRMGDVGTFAAEERTLLDTLANHASVAVENARLVQRLQDSLARQTELNRMKDDFVATVSHELRTPLTSIQGFVKTMLRTDATYSPQEMRSYLGIIDRQSERLRSLIEDLLIAARIESADVPMIPVPVSLEQLTRDVTHAFCREVTGRDVRLEVNGPLPRVESSEEPLHRILCNLLDNAIKYSPAGTPVIVRSRVVEGGVVLSVEDRGEGVPEHLQEAIFDRFYQVDQTSTRRAGGTGLGLYISRRLADHIGARLWLERSMPSEGSEFCLFVPFRAGSGEQPADVVSLSPVPA